MRKQAVLMMCHFCNDIVKDRYHKLISELDSDKYDVFVLFNNDTDLNFNFGEHSYVYSFRTEDLNELGYESIADTIVPGSTHFAVLNFFKEHNNYKHYWYVEYDVVFSGNWSALLDAFESNDADFITTGIQLYDEYKNGTWAWWSQCSTLNIPLERRVKSFNPICRFSVSSLTFLDTFLKSGVTGHQEMVIATVLYLNGFKLVDFGGSGTFVLPKYENKFYLGLDCGAKCTFRYRPIYTEEEVKQMNTNNKLFHPVK